MPAARSLIPPADSSLLGTFLMIVQQWPVGSRITVEHLRSDLEAAQIRPSQYGPLFRAACQRGLLRETGLSIIERKASRRGGRALLYARVEPGRELRRRDRASRPSTKRTDTTGPRR